MPRGVYYNHDAAITVHIDSSDWCEDDDPLAADMWREEIDYIMDLIETRWPSFFSCDRSASNDEHILLENHHAEVIVYEYCGLTSISVVPRTDSSQDYPELAEHWCQQIASNFQKLLDSAFKGKTMNRTSGYTLGIRQCI